MVRSRAPRTSPKISEEEFVAGAEKPAPADRTTEQRLAERASGRYFQLLSYRGTEAQKALIDYAAEREGTSIQKLLEGILMPELERRYGQDYDTSA
jgi:hypothetical protein